MPAILFDDAFNLLTVGMLVDVQDGTPAPDKKAMGERVYNHWFSLNPTGMVVELRPTVKEVVIRGPDRILPGGHSVRSFYTVKDRPNLTVNLRLRTANAEGMWFARLPKDDPYYPVVPKTGAQVNTLMGATQAEWDAAYRRARHPKLFDVERRLLDALEALVPDRISKLTPEQRKRLFPALEGDL